MELYSLVQQLSEKECTKIHESLTSKNAHITLAFFQHIRNTPESTEEKFLDRYDITSTALHMLKVRLQLEITSFFTI